MVGGCGSPNRVEGESRGVSVSVGKSVRASVGVTLIWVGIHNVSAWLYNDWCVPRNILAMLVSPVIINSTQCVALRWMLTHTAASLPVGTLVTIGNQMTAYLMM